MLAIKTNMMATTASRNLGLNYDQLSCSVERLSSGLRINSAKDDAAGLAVRELIRADVAALQQGSRNAMDGVSMLQAAEGALGEIDAILIRMRELAEQACTDTYSATQKQIMQNEFNELAVECTRIAQTTDFNDINILSSSTGTVKIGLGGGVADANLCISVEKSDMRAETLGLIGREEITAANAGNSITVSLISDDYLTNSDTANPATLTISFGGTDFDLSFGTDESMTLSQVVSEINTQAGDTVAQAATDTNGDFYLVLTTQERGTQTDLAVTNADGVVWAGGADAVATGDFTVTQQGTADLDLTAGDDVAINAVYEAIKQKDTYRAKLGYWMNRLEYASSVLDVQAENLMVAESRISDVDVAQEMSVLTRNQVLSQAGVAMLAQANSMPQMALQLLQA
jgi:flagellin